MTKTELIADLTSKFAEVAEPILQTPQPADINGNAVNWYDSYVMEVEGLGATFKHIQFYVLNEGTETETAYYKKDQVPAEILATN